MNRVARRKSFFFNHMQFFGEHFFITEPRSSWKIKKNKREFAFFQFPATCSFLSLSFARSFFIKQFFHSFFFCSFTLYSELHLLCSAMPFRFREANVSLLLTLFLKRIFVIFTLNLFVPFKVNVRFICQKKTESNDDQRLLAIRGFQDSRLGIYWK